MDRRVTLSADDVAELAEVSGANAVLLYGQFSFVLGEPCVSPQLVQSVRGALRERGLGGVLVPALVNGEGVMRGERVRLVVEGP